MRIHSSPWSAALVAALLSLGVSRAQADESAAEIARKARDQGSLNLVGLRAEMTLINVEKGGARQVRELVTQSKKIDGATRTLTRFKSPPEVAGAALLVIEGQGGDPDAISLYLPKIRRTRRIAPSSRGEPFMESEFAYADFSSGSIDEKTAAREKDAAVDGKAVYVLRASPADSPYARVVAYLDEQSYLPLKVEYYDKDGLVKVYTVQKVEILQGRTLATVSTMENVRTGRKTVISISHVAPADALDAAFTDRGLERG